MRPLLPALFAFGLAGSAQAANLDFTLVNSTGYQIDSVYVSEASSRSWGSDIMGKDALAEGESVDVEFSRGKACRWDLMVKYKDGDKATWNNLNLCDISRVTLFWNSTTQKTRAVTE